MERAFGVKIGVSWHTRELLMSINDDNDNDNDKNGRDQIYSRVRVFFWTKIKKIKNIIIKNKIW